MGSQKVRTHRLSESQRLHFIPVKLFLPAHCSAIMVKLSPLLRSFKRSQVLSGNSEQKASLLPCWISLTNWSKLKYSNLKNQTYSTYRTNLWSLKKEDFVLLDYLRRLPCYYYHRDAGSNVQNLWGMEEKRITCYIRYKRLWVL